MIMYISRRFKTNVCATVHYQALKEIFGDKNIIVVSLALEKDQNPEGAYKFPRYTKFGKIKRYLEGNTCYLSNDIIKQICKLIQKHEINSIFIDESIFGTLVRKIKKMYKNIKVVTFYHDIESVLYKEWLKEKGIKFIFEYFTSVHGEKLNQKYSDINLVLNHRDRRIFIEQYGRQPEGELPMAVQAPNFTEKDMSELKEYKLQHKKMILFVGAYYFPNVNGLKWFAQNVMINLPEKYCLLVVGRGMEKIRDQYSAFRNIIIVGEVQNLAAYYNNADIVVAPIFEGGGMKQKTAEAFAYGRCFIGTDESMMGYEDAIGIPGIFCCNTGDEMVEAIRQIDNEDAYGYHNDIYLHYVKHYSFEAAKNNLRKIMK